MRSAIRPGPRQRPLPNAEIYGGEVSFDHLIGAPWGRYHASLGRSVANSPLARPRNGSLLLLRVRAAESGPSVFVPCRPFGRYLGKSGHPAKVPNTTRMTQSDALRSSIEECKRITRSPYRRPEISNGNRKCVISHHPLYSQRLACRRYRQATRRPRCKIRFASVTPGLPRNAGRSTLSPTRFGHGAPIGETRINAKLEAR
jgi:hypothetical protein